MADLYDQDVADQAPLDRHPNRAVAHFQFGASSGHFEVHMTPAGLLAVGALVSAILLSVVPIVRASTRHLQRRAGG